MQPPVRAGARDPGGGPAARFPETLQTALALPCLPVTCRWIGRREAVAKPNETKPAPYTQLSLKPNPMEMLCETSPPTSSPENRQIPPLISLVGLGGNYPAGGGEQAISFSHIKALFSINPVAPSAPGTSAARNGLHAGNI